jgi:hypothetical protein
MQWNPGESRYYIWTKEGYTVSKMWLGEEGSWIYTAWGPPLPVEGGRTRPNMLKVRCGSPDEAKLACEEHLAQAQKAKDQKAETA